MPTNTIIQPQTVSYSANITSYDGATRKATLGAPSGFSGTWPGVNLSLGVSNSQGPLTSSYSLTGTYTNIAQATLPGANGVATLSTDEAGNFVGIFNVPSGRFQTGNRIFRIDNRTVDTDPRTATTYAEASFTAGGLLTNIGASDFQAGVDSSAPSFTRVSQQSSQLIDALSVYSPYDPIAQSFTVSKDNYPNGIFLYSVKLYFAKIPTNSNTPITVSIVPTQNGYPTGQSLSYSTISLAPNQVKANTTPYYMDPNTYTNFVFEAPVYIQSGVPYAIMVNSSSPDYQLHYAQQGQTAIASSTGGNLSKIGTAPYVGGLFESQNAQTWTADLTKSLMFIIDQCVFNTSVTPQVQFVVPAKLPYRKLGTKDILHKVSANSVSNLMGTYSQNMPVDALNVSSTDFSPTNTLVNYTYNATLVNGTLTGTKPITPGAYGTPTPEHMYLNDGLGQRALISSSNASFTLNATLTSTDPNVSPIVSDDGVSLYAIRYFINNMGIGNNTISIINAGLGYNAQTAIVTVTSKLANSNTASDTGGTPAVFGLTTNTTTGSITSVYAISPGSGYLASPTLTISGANTGIASVVIHGEDGPSGGNAYAKYFTKKVVLAPGNVAGDLRVFYTAYKPVGTQIYVYYRILSSQDNSTFESGSWQLMTSVTNQNTYSSSRTDLYEFECAPGTFSSGIANNTVSYTNSTGQTFNAFTQFAIKVVLSTADNTTVPFLTDIRALALPAGTGI